MKTEWSTYSLVDTNVLVYAVDPSDGFKHEIANELFESALEKNGKFAVSTQILAEFANVCIKLAKNDPGISLKESEIIISTIIEIRDLPKLVVMPETVIHAMKLNQQFGVGLFDALIAATMKEHGITTIYTEDKEFEKIEGIKAVNPFEKRKQ
ncbi:MAG: PIN domain-containing protein [Nanoarchaeota archaeon]